MTAKPWLSKCTYCGETFDQADTSTVFLIGFLHSKIERKRLALCPICTAVLALLIPEGGKP